MKLISLVFLLGGLAGASPITIALDNASLIAGNGASVSFTGVLTNTTASLLFINSDFLTIAGPPQLDDSMFLVNAPISLAGSTASGDFVMFDVSIPLGTAPGKYSGQLRVLGGATDTDLTNLGSVPFSVIVPVPEPKSSLILLPILALLIARKMSVAFSLRSRRQPRAGCHLDES